MIWLQMTANTGPSECCLALKKALLVLHAEAEKAKVEVCIVAQLEGPPPQ